MRPTLMAEEEEPKKSLDESSVKESEKLAVP